MTNFQLFLSLTKFNFTFSGMPDISSYWNNSGIVPPTCPTPVESIKSSPSASPIRSPTGSPVNGSFSVPSDEKNFQSSVVPTIYQQVLHENAFTTTTSPTTTRSVEEKHLQCERETETLPKISKIESLAKNNSPSKSKLKGKKTENIKKTCKPLNAITG